MSEKHPGLPNIFEYDNYRQFVSDTFQAMKHLDSKFSLRYFAQRAGFSSHNFIKLVISGKSNLSTESIGKFAKGLKFNQEQSLFFKNLVLLNQAKTNEEKQRYSREILRSRTYRKIHPLRESQFQYFANWYVSAVRELVALPAFNEDPEWIAKHLIPNIKPQEAERAIQDLLNLGLLIRNEEKRLVQSSAAVSTPSEVSSTYVSSWHKEYLTKAAESIDNVPREKRDITALTFIISRKDLGKLKELAAKLRQDVEVLSVESTDKDALYQLNIQLFPLAETDRSNEE